MLYYYKLSERKNTQKGGKKLHNFYELFLSLSRKVHICKKLHTTMKGHYKMSDIQKFINDFKMDESVIDEWQSVTIKEFINQLITKIDELSSTDGRKSQVESILRDQGPIHIKDIAQQLNISTKNVSSQLTYLRSDNVNVCTDNKGRKFIMD